MTDIVEDLDYTLLDKQLDKVKTRVFRDNNAAFLGPLMSSIPFIWSRDIPTACTNGLWIQWNPDWFLSLPEKTRLTVLLHEIWHIALLHMLRRGTRDGHVWNWAADIFINNMLYYQGYTFDGTHPWINDNINDWRHPEGSRPIGNYDPDKSVEEIYDALLIIFADEMDIQSMLDLMGEDDLIEPEQEDKAQVEQQIVAQVVQAQTAAKLAGAGGLTVVELILKRFLQPKLPWEMLLFQWMSDLGEYDYTWRRPNRRHQEIYLPSMEEDEGRLEHLMYFLDVSGSVSDKDVLRFNSEVKYIWDAFRPQKLTIVLFDDRIQKEIVFEGNDEFDEITVVGRGGTNLIPVRDHIIEHNPTAAIIFTDLHVSPMQPLPPGQQVPILWVGVNASTSHIPLTGRLIHIKK